MADYLFLTISKRSGFCRGCHFCTEARRWHEWNLSCGHRMTYLAATTRVIWRPPDNYFAAARELFWWPPYNTSGDRYIILLGLDPLPPPLEFSKYTSQRTTFLKKIFCITKRYFCMRISKFYVIISKYHESACSVTAVRQFCGLPRKYQGCASFIYFLHMYRTTVPLSPWHIFQYTPTFVKSVKAQMWVKNNLTRSHHMH